MSEWKWCLDCGHHYAEHQDGQGPCGHIEGDTRCDCKQFWNEVANFL